MKKFLLFVLVASFTSCAVIRPGEAGVKQRFGNFQAGVRTDGIVFFNPITSKIVKESIQTNNLEMFLNLPSKEGLSVDSEISILYRLETEKVPEVLQTLGPNYKTIITSVFRSASADVCSQFFAKDMHSGKRSDIEEAIKLKMANNLIEKGIVIETIMRRVGLPLYIPLVSVIASFLLIYKKEKKYNYLKKYVVFGCAFIILIFAEIFLKFTGFSFINLSLYLFSPLILFILLYALLLKNVTAERLLK